MLAGSQVTQQAGGQAGGQAKCRTRQARSEDTAWLAGKWAEERKGWKGGMEERHESRGARRPNPCSHAPICSNCFGATTLAPFRPPAGSPTRREGETPAAWRPFLLFQSALCVAATLPARLSHASPASRMPPPTPRPSLHTQLQMARLPEVLWPGHLSPVSKYRSLPFPPVCVFRAFSAEPLSQFSPDKPAASDRRTGRRAQPSLFAT